MNKITHQEALSFVQSAEHIAHNNTTEELDEIDSTALILDTIQIVLDNDEELTFLELAITKDGYVIRYEANTAVTADYVLSQLERGLEVLTESLLENDEPAPFDNTFSLGVSSRTNGF